MKELTHFIGGKHANSTSVRFCDGFEPMTGEVISRVPLASKAEVRAAIQPSTCANVRSGGDSSGFRNAARLPSRLIAGAAVIGEAPAP
jgi:hypothetical protein